MPVHTFDFASLNAADLVVDAVYQGGTSGNAGDDPLAKLLPVGNQGGFRTSGGRADPEIVVLYSGMDDPDWPDALSLETGSFEYYGDNKKPGRTLHDTSRGGNSILRDAFDAIHAAPARRHDVPPFLIFTRAGGRGRDVVFRGLAAPGSPSKSQVEDLVAIWKTSGGKRFQNYLSVFTILDVPVVEREWIDQLTAGDPLGSNCPSAWSRWRSTGHYTAMLAPKVLEYRTPDEQVPSDRKSRRMIETIRDHFAGDETRFEPCAARIAAMMDSNIVEYQVTRPSVDGGRDAIGFYRIGSPSSRILVDFSLEAKCYALSNGVGVKEVARLISRLRHRQFGILVTTSYLATQAYKEIIEDQHPVVVIAANDILEILAAHSIATESSLLEWLNTNFG